jgi:hypothetical protein
MGSQLCRFVDFEKGPCLEFIEAEDDKAYLDFVPDGMTPYCPGISLALFQESETTIGDYEREFHHLLPYTLHVSYDGSADPARPGWNYLNFAIPVVADTFIWLTEYDEPRPVKEYVISHPNTVKGIVGIVFDLDVENLQQLAQLVKGDITEGSFKIDKLKVWSKNTIDDFPNVCDKAFPLTAITLKAENLDYFAAPVEGVREVSFMSRPAMHIETNRLSWDLLVIT